MRSRRRRPGWHWLGADAARHTSTTSSRSIARTVSACTADRPAARASPKTCGVQLLDGDVLRIGRGLVDLLRAAAAARARTRLDEVRPEHRVSHQRAAPSSSWVVGTDSRTVKPSGEAARVQVGPAQCQRIGELLGRPRPPAPWVRQRPTRPATPSSSRGSAVNGTSKSERRGDHVLARAVVGQHAHPVGEPALVYDGERQPASRHDGGACRRLSVIARRRTLQGCLRRTRDAPGPARSVPAAARSARPRALPRP